jgi:hypothetical protein
MCRYLWSGDRATTGGNCDVLCRARTVSLEDSTHLTPQTGAERDRAHHESQSRQRDVLGLQSQDQGASRKRSAPTRGRERSDQCSRLWHGHACGEDLTALTSSNPAEVPVKTETLNFCTPRRRASNP